MCSALEAETLVLKLSATNKHSQPYKWTQTLAWIYSTQLNTSFGQQIYWNVGHNKFKEKQILDDTFCTVSNFSSSFPGFPYKVDQINLLRFFQSWAIVFSWGISGLQWCDERLRLLWGLELEMNLLCCISELEMHPVQKKEH